MATQLSAYKTASDTMDEALAPLSVEADAVAGAGAVLLTEIAVVLLRVSAVGVLASPLLVAWLLY